MASRLKLHEELVGILGSRNVYFQPPESKRMNYPAIVYSRSNIENIHADDDVYLQACRYQVTIIDADPDSEIVERMSKFKRVRYKHHFTSDNLNHDVFEIYY